MRATHLCVLLGAVACATGQQATGGAYGERAEADRGTQRGSDIGLRALRAVSRGGAGSVPTKMVSAEEILLTFREGIDAGFYMAPHDEFEDVEDESLKVDPLFSSQTTKDIYVSILAMIATISASASGIGGGGLLVPIYLLVMGWNISLAVPLSNATIFGNAITNIFINFPLRHPTADRPLVDFDLALVLIPMELTGSILGVLLNLIFPQWLTLVCLLFLLLFTTYRTYNKGKATWEKENKERRREERKREAELANIGDTKMITLEDDEGNQVEMEVVHGADKSVTVEKIHAALPGAEGKHMIVKEGDGERLSLAFDSVDQGARYHISFVDVDEEAGQVDHSYRTAFEQAPPTESDYAKLIVIDSESMDPATKQHLGRGVPLGKWSTDMVVSWMQTITDSSDALCYEVENQMISGADLLAVSQDMAIGEDTFTRLHVADEADRGMLTAHVKMLAEHDYMLLVHSTAELPWGSWNRSAEWVDGDEQDGDRDLDGWLEDDPNHPKHRPATYVSSQAYVSVAEWTCDDVCKWLSKVTDYNYGLLQSVRQNDIDGRSLLRLTAEDLKAIGVPQLGPRLALLDRVREVERLYDEHDKIVRSERSIPWLTNLTVLFLSWLMLLILSVLRGGGKGGGQSPVANWEGKSQEEFCGSSTYWILWFIGVPVLVVVTYFAGNYLLNKHRLKLKTHFKFHEGDVKWTKHRVRVYPAIVVIAGVLAGLLGVGGAMVTGPLMLEMGMVPRVSTATSSFLIIFTTGVAAVAYVAVGSLKIDYALWFAFVGGSGAALGLNIIGMLLKKYNRQSLVIWSLTIVFILAAVGTVVAGVFRLQQDISEGNSLGFRSIC